MTGQLTLAAGATSLLASKTPEDFTPPTVSVTSDSRSVLTPASDAQIRNVFSTQVRISQASLSMSRWWEIDDALVFKVCRSAIESRYPRAVYPVGLDQIALETLQLLPSNLIALVEFVLHSRSRSRWRLLA